MSSSIDPLQFSIEVPLSTARAFELFTDQLTRWWPLAQFSIGQSHAVACGFDSHAGGNVWERRDDGERFVWGTVLEWEPPRRFVITWHPGRPAETAQEVEVRFIACETGTRVELEHRKWDLLGPDAQQTRSGYESGWAHVFGHLFFEHCRQAARD